MPLPPNPGPPHNPPPPSPWAVGLGLSPHPHRIEVRRLGRELGCLSGGGQDLLRPWDHERDPLPSGNVGANTARSMAAHRWRLCRHAWYRRPHSRPGHGWLMRGVAVPAPARPADLRAWYSGDRSPITSCLCRSQLWCPLRGAPAIGAHPSGQVCAARAARHDMPHREHHHSV